MDWKQRTELTVGRTAVEKLEKAFVQLCTILFVKIKKNRTFAPELKSLK